MPAKNNIFVLIDTSDYMCYRYVGRTRELKVQAAKDVTRQEIETIRLRPDIILAPEDPEVA